MKKILTLLFLQLSGIAFAQVPTSEIEELMPLVPGIEHIESIIATIDLVERHHLKSLWMDDSLSSMMYTFLLDDIDNEKLFFLQDDIDTINKYQYAFDNFLIDGDLDIPFRIFNLHKSRAIERLQKVDSILSAGFDFELVETFETDRNKRSWASSNHELDDLWRKFLKKQMIDKMTSGIVLDSALVSIKNNYATKLISYRNYKSDDYFMWYMNAFLKTLDPHTYFMTKKYKDNWLTALNATYVGIGITFIHEGEKIIITKISPGSPASEDGRIQIGSTILSLKSNQTGEFVDVTNWSDDRLVQKVRGEDSTAIELVIGNGDNERDTVKLIRSKIINEESSATSEIIEIAENGKNYKLGVINIPSFYWDYSAENAGDPDYKSLTKDVKNILTSLKQNAVDGVIIDLRNNSGGYLYETNRLIGLFIHKGPLVQTRNSQMKIKKYYDQDFGSIFYDGPLAVLINRNSASASEIFAAAIQDYKRGIILGERSFGKGSVQQTYELDKNVVMQLNEKIAKRENQKLNTGELVSIKNRLEAGENKLGSVNITISKFYRISGQSTQLKGVQPDISFASNTDLDRFGERKYTSALPCDEIESASYETSNYLTSKTKVVINKSYKNHLKNDSELIRFVSQPEDKASSEVSLKMKEVYSSTSRTEMDGNIIVKLSSDENLNKRLSTDLYLKETLRLMAVLCDQ